MSQKSTKKSKKKSHDTCVSSYVTAGNRVELVQNSTTSSTPYQKTLFTSFLLVCYIYLLINIMNTKRQETRRCPTFRSVKNQNTSNQTKDETIICSVVCVFTFFATFFFISLVLSLLDGVSIVWRLDVALTLFICCLISGSLASH